MMIIPKAQAVAFELNIPIVAVSAPLEGRAPNDCPTPPELDALNGIEVDADVVIFLHRDDYYDVVSPRAGEADLIVAKNRGGHTDTVTVAAQLHISRFVDIGAIPPAIPSPSDHPPVDNE